MICAPVSFTSSSFRDEAAVATGMAWRVDVLPQVEEGLAKGQSKEDGPHNRDRPEARIPYGPVSASLHATGRDLISLRCAQEQGRRNMEPD